MTPADCRNAINVNRVRCFHKGALVETVAIEKWELVKIICTQPYSKQFQFGLSFVKLHVLAESLDKTKTKPLVPETFVATSSTSAASPFAKFKIRADSSDSDSDTTSSLFSRWKQAKGTEMGGTGAASGKHFIHIIYERLVF